MREIDFLPTWYPNLRRQQFLLRVQQYASVLLVAGLASYLFVSHRTRDAAASDLARVDADLAQTRAEVKQLDELLELQGQLLNKQRIVSLLGLPAEASHVISEIAQCLPPQISLMDLQVNTVETQKSLTDIVRTSGPSRDKNNAALISRRMEVTVKGIAPTEAEVAQLFSELSQRRLFEKLRLLKSIEERRDDHLTRVFEISFSIPLDYDAAGAGEKGGR